MSFTGKPRTLKGGHHQHVVGRYTQHHLLITACNALVCIQRGRVYSAYYCYDVAQVEGGARYVVCDFSYVLDFLLSYVFGMCQTPVVFVVVDVVVVVLQRVGLVGCLGNAAPCGSYIPCLSRPHTPIPWLKRHRNMVHSCGLMLFLVRTACVQHISPCIPTVEEEIDFGADEEYVHLLLHVCTC